LVADPYALAGEAADRIADLTGRASHDALVVLGSGWGPAADAFGEPVAAFAMTRVPGFHAPVADGHRGEIRSCLLGDVSVLLLLGRTHLYEGRGLDPVVHPVRTAAAAGVRRAVLTNANGSLRADWAVGRPVLLADHLALTATSPLVGPRFTDLTDVWSPRLRGPGQGGRPVAGRRGLRMAARPAL
jgi:purine-nucleoside phosphorylase